MTGYSGEGPMTLSMPPLKKGMSIVHTPNCDDLSQVGTTYLTDRAGLMRTKPNERKQ